MSNRPFLFLHREKKKRKNERGKSFNTIQGTDVWNAER